MNQYNQFCIVEVIWQRTKVKADRRIMDRIFHTPEGVRDIINEECARKKILQNTIAEVFHRYGYMDIETPSFEYFEVFSREDRKSVV